MKPDYLTDYSENYLFSPNVFGQLVVGWNCKWRKFNGENKWTKDGPPAFPPPPTTLKMDHLLLGGNFNCRHRFFVFVFLHMYFFKLQKVVV